MIVVQTSIPIDPDRRAEALDEIAELAEQSRAEDGTLDYRATTDIENPNVVRFFEQYEDVAALEAHVETEHYEEWTEQLPKFVDGRMKTTQFRSDGDPKTVEFGVEDLD
ncbi:putative quinol monooxygenase [Halorussus halophilus]|uniref:putative quinol monooxygenase n=1 Tax=Halorussus halophilus TaxID=2650975 RepID=UPI0017888933|nr:putative quinol monooxygenase [Halorussus halophilus]